MNLANLNTLNHSCCTTSLALRMKSHLIATFKNVRFSFISISFFKKCTRSSIHPHASIINSFFVFGKRRMKKTITMSITIKIVIQKQIVIINIPIKWNLIFHFPYSRVKTIDLETSWAATHRDSGEKYLLQVLCSKTLVKLQFSLFFSFTRK